MQLDLPESKFCLSAMQSWASDLTYLWSICKVGKLRIICFMWLSFPRGSGVKNPLANAGDARSMPESGSSPGEGNGHHSNILTWEIPWMEEPGGLQAVGPQNSGLATKQQTLHVLIGMTQ